MSGSGLWVHWGDEFHLAGVLRGREKGSDTKGSHIIEFTPVWRLVEWVRGLGAVSGGAAPCAVGLARPGLGACRHLQRGRGKGPGKSPGWAGGGRETAL